MSAFAGLKRLKPLWNLLLILLITLVLFETLTRPFFAFRNQLFDYRYQSINTGGFRVVDDRLWTYKPNSTVDIASVYGFPYPYSTFKVEFRCRFDTNEFGLVKGIHPYDPAKKTILLAGDSFTEGQGGCPWTHYIEEQFPQYNIINGGLMGIGVDNYWDVYQLITKSGIKIDHVILLTIAGDYARNMNSFWITQNMQCFQTGNCKDSRQFNWTARDINASNAQLEESAQKASLQHYGTWDLSKSLNFFIQHYSQTYTLYNGLKHRGWNPNIAIITPRAEIALKNFKAAYPDMKIVMIPRKIEAGLNYKASDWIEVEKYLKTNGYKFNQCNISFKNYLYYDAHPTKAGYQELAPCVAGIIRGFK